MSKAAKEQAPPLRTMFQLLLGKQLTVALSGVAKLGVPDHMSNDLIAVEELAAKTGAHAPSLYRVMRMLASVGVFRQEGRKFALTPVGEVLRTDSPTSLRHIAMMFGDDWSIRAYAYMVDCLKTGGDGITMAYGKNIFEYLAEHPKEAENFNNAMTDGSVVAAQSVPTAYDFTGIKRLADIGGGHGILITSILKRYPQMQGVLFDLPEVVAGVPQSRVAEFNGRLKVEGGSFFERVPEGCDAYIMKAILHDWGDEYCRKILKLCREQLPSNGRVLVCDLVVPEDTGPSLSKMMDVEMLVMTVGGKERTEAEFADLFASAGLKLNRVVKTPTLTCVLEAVPA